MNKEDIVKAIELFTELPSQFDYIRACEETAIEALQAQLNDGWIGVEEKLPNDGCDVIIVFKWRGRSANWSEIGIYDELKDEWYNSEGNLREVTHWRPFPSPPKSK